MLLVGLGALSAVYGILQASVASDLKRLLAYSTTENVGLIVLALGHVGAAARRRSTPPADAALVACLLLVVSHAAFKATLFLGAGVVLHGHRRARPRPARRAGHADAGGPAPRSAWAPWARRRCRSPPGSSPSGRCCRP